MTFEEERRRGCLSKVRYVTVREAEGHAAFLNTYTSSAPSLSVYQCMFCQGFHLTSSGNQHNEDSTL